MDGKSVGIISLQEPLPWMVYVDGAATHRRSGVGLVLISIEKMTIEKSPRLGFSVTNNEAKVHYLPLEKAILMVVHATCKLLHYFQAHTVVVLTQLPFRSLL